MRGKLSRRGSGDGSTAMRRIVGALLNMGNRTQRGLQRGKSLRSKREQERLESCRRHDRERVKRPDFMLFGFANSEFSRPDRKRAVGSEMRMHDGRMLVPFGLVPVMDVLGGSEKKGLEYRKTKLGCEH